MEEMKSFYSMTRQELLDMTQCFKAAEDDYAYIEDNDPNYQSPPSDPNATDEYDVYQARLKVLAGLEPKTVELIKIADGIKDPGKRQRVEREAVQSYYAELAHYWTEDEVLAWQRSNPVGTGWLCEFGRVYHKPRRTIDPVNHDLALNWLRRNYNLLPEEELVIPVFKRILKWLKKTASFWLAHVIDVMPPAESVDQFLVTPTSQLPDGVVPPAPAVGPLVSQ
jgi:hypothetical protein